MNSDLPGRDLCTLKLPMIGKVVVSDGVVPWVVLDAVGEPVGPIQVFLRDFVARGNRRGSVRSYAYDLHRWWRFLAAVGVSWDKATTSEARDLALWMQITTKHRRHPRTKSAATAGKVNPVTRKACLPDGFASSTVRHSNAVIRSFYEFWIGIGEGPLVNPVPRASVEGRRSNAHHNPLMPYRAEGRLRYNPKLPKRRPRSIPEDRWRELFASLRSNRDRAIFAFAISSAARAGELLGMCGVDVDWGNQLIRVKRKGSGAEQWLPANPDAFVWLRLYLCDVGNPDPAGPLWLTLRRRKGAAGSRERVPLNYEAWRAVIRRANEVLGANWTMHDARHTCALRMVRDERLSVRDVQWILGHAHVSTTEVYLVEDDDVIVSRIQEHYAAQAAGTPRSAPAAQGYEQAHLDVLFGTVPYDA